MRKSPNLPIPRRPNERGEWVELLFMANATRLGLKVCKPWSSGTRYDFILEHRGRCFRVQVKSTLSREPRNGDYRCCYETSRGVGDRRQRRPYTPRQLDFLAAYVIPRDTWFIIPARAIRTRSLCLDPDGLYPRNPYRRYREAWNLLLKPDSRLQPARRACSAPGCRTNSARSQLPAPPWKPPASAGERCVEIESALAAGARFGGRQTFAREEARGGL